MREGLGFENFGEENKRMTEFESVERERVIRELVLHITYKPLYIYIFIPA